MNKNIIKKIIIFIVSCAILIIIDQFTKSVAEHTLSGQFCFNKRLFLF